MPNKRRSTGNFPHGEIRRFDSREDLWRTVALLIEELDCADRCVEYSIDNSVKSYDEVQSWLDDVLADEAEIRYIVEPDYGGLVRVDFVAIASGS